MKWSLFFPNIFWGNILSDLVHFLDARTFIDNYEFLMMTTVKFLPKFVPLSFWKLKVLILKSCSIV